jgi:hypothetical protein
VECYKCHQLGHFQYECSSRDKKANYAEVDEEEEMLLMAVMETNNAKREEVWYLDFGCTNHMCEKRQFLFAQYRPISRKRISHSYKAWSMQLYHPRRGLIMQTWMTTNRMFVLLANVVPETSTCLQTMTKDESELWHRRYGHLSYKGLQTLRYRDMVRAFHL